MLMQKIYFSEIHEEVAAPIIELSEDEAVDVRRRVRKDKDERMDVSDGVAEVEDDAGRSSKVTRRRKKAPADMTFSSGKY